MKESEKIADTIRAFNKECAGLNDTTPEQQATPTTSSDEGSELPSAIEMLPHQPGNISQIHAAAGEHFAPESEFPLHPALSNGYPLSAAVIEPTGELAVESISAEPPATAKILMPASIERSVWGVLFGQSRTTGR